jgi:hypothetical protein
MHKSDLKYQSSQHDAQALRQKAEELVSNTEFVSKENLADMSPALVLKMLHELQVHQVELERRTQADAITAFGHEGALF